MYSEEMIYQKTFYNSHITTSLTRDIKDPLDELHLMSQEQWKGCNLPVLPSSKHNVSIILLSYYLYTLYVL